MSDEAKRIIDSLHDQARDKQMLADGNEDIIFAADAKALEDAADLIERLSEKKIFKSRGNLVYYSKNNAEALWDLNTAIKSLYAIEVGALSASTLNTPTYVEYEIQRLGIEAGKWAGKLEMMRSLLFGDDLDWDFIQQHLSSIPNSREE